MEQIGIVQVKVHGLQLNPNLVVRIRRLSYEAKATQLSQTVHN